LPYLFKDKLNNSYKTINNRLDKNIQILFVTTTPAYKTIIECAAKSCEMPFNNKT